MCEAAFGARRVELLGPEVEALGDLLYYGLTVFGGASVVRMVNGFIASVCNRIKRSPIPLLTYANTGMETLGQEYGHLMFVEQRSAGRFLPLSRLRRAVLVGATVVCNYVSEVQAICCVCIVRCRILILLTVYCTYFVWFCPTTADPPPRRLGGGLRPTVAAPAPAWAGAVAAATGEGGQAD